MTAGGRAVAIPSRVSFNVMEDDMTELEQFAEESESQAGGEGRLIVSGGRVTIVDVPGQEEEELPGGIVVVGGLLTEPPQQPVSRTVRFLRDHGFKVISGGDGGLRGIVMDVNPDGLADECRGLVELLDIHGVTVGPADGHGHPSVTGVFDPVSGVSTVSLSGVRDAELFKA